MLWLTATGVEFTGTVHSINEKKGMAKYEVPYSCGRCGGAGGAEAWKFTGFTCFECGGHGFRGRTRSITVYSPERYTKLEASRNKRQAEKAAKAAAEATARAERQRQAFQERCDAFNTAHPGFAERLRSFMADNEFLADLHAKLTETFGSLTEGQVNAAESTIEKIERARASRYVEGNIGDRVTLTLTVDRVLIPDEVGYSRIPPSWTYICHDSDGNAVIYRGRSEAMPYKDETGQIVAKIKSFDEYRGTKQTAIERPRKAK